MFFLMVAVLTLASVPLLGGRLGRLAGLRLRHSWLVFAALVGQILVISVWTGAPASVQGSVHVSSYVVAAAFLWLNRKLPGLGLVSAGAALNGVTIAVNGGTLPASRRALVQAGLRVSSHWSNSGPLAHPRLRLLGDIFASPSWLPVRDVVSAGDLVILAGALVCLHVSCASLPARAVRGVRQRRRAAPAGLPG